MYKSLNTWLNLNAPDADFSLSVMVDVATSLPTCTINTSGRSITRGCVSVMFFGVCEINQMPTHTRKLKVRTPACGSYTSSGFSVPLKINILSSQAVWQQFKFCERRSFEITVNSVSSCSSLCCLVYMKSIWFQTSWCSRVMQRKMHTFLNFYRAQ